MKIKEVVNPIIHDFFYFQCLLCVEMPPPQPPVTSPPLLANSASPSNLANKSLTEKIVHVPQVSYHNVQSYIKELEISEGQLSSCLRNVYDNNQKDEFMKQLEERVKRYDMEIEKLCNANYQSFVDTFNELLTVREDAVQIKVTLFLLFIRLIFLVTYFFFLQTQATIGRE